MNCEKIQTFEIIVNELQTFWSKIGCINLQSFDAEVGAGTFHHATFFKAIDEKILKVAYTQLTKRPQDSYIKQRPTKRCFFHQYQVILKPPEKNIRHLYLLSLQYIGFMKNIHDIVFIEDDWKSPSLAAHGVGWEVRVNGLEISQITYFQKIGGIICNPTAAEITYGLERIALVLQKKKKINHIVWAHKNKKTTYYKDLFNEYEKEITYYNTRVVNEKNLQKNIENLLIESNKLIKKKLIFSAYDVVIKLSHIYNQIETKNTLSIIYKKNLIMKINTLSKKIAAIYKNKKDDNLKI